MADPSIIFKRLLKKHMEGVADNNEIETLRLMWHLFHDAEIVAFIEELQQDIPVKLQKSKQDSVALAAEVLKKYREKHAEKLKYSRLQMVSWAASCILIVIAVAVLYTLQKQEGAVNILCGHAGEGDIATAEFYCTFDIGGQQHFVIDSNGKGMLRRYGTLAILLRPGVIQYRRMPYLQAADSAKNIVQHIGTNNMQQYIIELPDRSRIRLNAMTTIKILPDRLNSNEQYVELVKGAIYIEGNRKSPIPIVVKTPSVTFIANGSYFSAQIDKKGTLLAVEKGEVAAENSYGERIIRQSPDLSHYIKAKITGEKDTVNTYKSAGIALVTNWRNAERVYKNVALDYFVAHMAQWYGFRFTNLDCLPEKKLSAVICYKAAFHDFIAVLRNSGVQVRQTADGYAFCDPEPASGQIAIAENY